MLILILFRIVEIGFRILFELFAGFGIVGFIAFFLRI